jgi:hypothetical protein
MMSIRPLIRVAAAAFVVLFAAGPARADERDAASITDLKAAFVLNFVKFTEWPSALLDSRITVCIAGDDDLAAALSATISTQQGDVPVMVTVVNADGPVNTCQVLFVGERNSRKAPLLIEQCAPLPVLTVGDSARFARGGGMIELFVESGRVRFAVNVDAVQRSHLRLSSRVLGLATIIRDTHAK